MYVVTLGPAVIKFVRFFAGMNNQPHANSQKEKREHIMDTTTIGLTVAAIIVGILYLQRRRARLQPRRGI